jgi:hypothetical protein
VPVFTGQDLCEALRDQNPNLMPGGNGGASFSQLQPVLPQSAADVARGVALFVLDVSSLWGLGP